MILTTTVPNALYRINDKVNFNWTINMDTMSVAGYLCQQATTSFTGRQYTAWFTIAIPINDGPYKFSGLPGLIMKLNDSKGYFSFECIGLDVLKLKERFAIKTDTYLPVSQSRYNELVNLYFDDRVDYAKEVMGLEYKVIKGSKTPVKKKKPLSIEIF